MAKVENVEPLSLRFVKTERYTERCQEGQKIPVYDSLRWSNLKIYYTNTLQKI